MRPLGPLLASGRDADIFEYGPGLVLRRSRAGHSMAHEARTMAYLRSRGYPVPAVEEVSDDGLDLVIERIEGHSMVDAIAKAPWTIRRRARTLAALHRQLHEIAPPDFLAPAPIGRGDRVVHLDLHPLNVMVGPKGVFVIDWTNAALGDPLDDVGLAWVLMAAGQVPGGRLEAAAIGRFRALLVNAFVKCFDRAAVATHLRELVTWKASDPHMSAEEVSGMWRVVARAEARR